MPGWQRHLRFTLGRPKFQPGSPDRCLKHLILRLTTKSSEQTTKFPAHSALLKRQRNTSFDWNPLLRLLLQRSWSFWKWCQMNNLIVFEKPSIIKSWLFLQHYKLYVTTAWSKNWEKVVIRGKASWFQITHDIGMLLTLQVCSIFYLAKNTNGTVGGFFYHLFSIFYALLTFCCTLCENFWKACKNIPVFKNDSQPLFKIIFQSLFNLHCHMRCP